MRAQEMEHLLQKGGEDVLPGISPCSRNYATGISNVVELNSWNMYSSLNKSHGALPWTSRNDMMLRSAMAVELPIFLKDKRLLSTQVKAPTQARQMCSGIDMGF